MNLGRNICVGEVGNLSSRSILNFDADSLRLSCNSTIRHLNRDSIIETRTREGLCEIETGQTDESYHS